MMTVNAFWMGVATTVFAEMLLLIAICIVYGGKKK